MARSTLPLFPSDDGWPYPDITPGPDIIDPSEPDLDALDLVANPHAYDALTADERAALFHHFGLQGYAAMSMKQLGPVLGCSRVEARDLLGAAIAKVRLQLM